MLRFEMVYDFGTTREKGTERLHITGKCPSYHVRVKKDGENLKDVKWEYDETDPTTVAEQKIIDSYHNEIAAFKEKYPDIVAPYKQKSAQITRNRRIVDIDFSNVEVIETTSNFEPGDKLIGTMIDGEEIDTYEQYRLGTEMAKFLNFNIDSFINGELDFDYTIPPNEYDEEDDDDDIAIRLDLKKLAQKELDTNIQKVVLYKSHDIACLENRNNILQYIFNGESTINGFLNMPMPVFIRMFPELIINFETWEYNNEGIARIKEYQDYFRGLCESYFIDTEKSGTTPIEVYCDSNGKERGTTKQLRTVREELRTIVLGTQNNIKKYYETGECAGEPLREALLGEFYAMLSKDNVYFRKCEVCGRYFVTNKSNKCCTPFAFWDINKKAGEIEMENYFSRAVTVPQPIGKGIVDTEGNPICRDEVSRFYISSCTKISDCQKHNDKRREEGIKRISNDTKNRLRAWLSSSDITSELRRVNENLVEEIEDILKYTVKTKEEE